MRTEEIEFFRMLLLQRLKDLQQQGEETISFISSQAKQSSDVIDRATVESDQSLFLRLKARESRLAQKIKLALSRIDDDSFGICETCGEEISIARLKARPVAMQCIECKIKAEAIKKTSGL